MIKAKTEKVGTETMVKGFVWGMTPSDMLNVMRSIRLLMEDKHTHPIDKEWARKTLKEIHESTGGDAE